MTKSKYYDFLKNIVAIIPKYTKGKPPKFPSIIGTGFMIEKDGIILTCDHVARAINNLYRIEGTSDIHVFCISFEYSYKKLEKKTKINIGIKTLPIVEIFYINDFDYNVPYAPPSSVKPDIAFLQIMAKNLPVAKLCQNYFNIIPGDEVFTMGFPLGKNLMVLKEETDEWIQNFLPIIQKGIISGVLPFRCPDPYGFLINIMAQEGSSGSPLILTKTNEIIGIINKRVYQGSPKKTDFIPTNFSYAIGLKAIPMLVELVKTNERFRDISNFKDIDEFEEKSLEPSSDFILYNYKEDNRK